jgi:hypothetical protein
MPETTQSRQCGFPQVALQGPNVPEIITISEKYALVLTGDPGYETTGFSRVESQFQPNSDSFST